MIFTSKLIRKHSRENTLKALILYISYERMKENCKKYSCDNDSTFKLNEWNENALLNTEKKELTFMSLQTNLWSC